MNRILSSGTIAGMIWFWSFQGEMSMETQALGMLTLMVSMIWESSAFASALEMPPPCWEPSMYWTKSGSMAQMKGLVLPQRVEAAAKRA